MSVVEAPIVADLDRDLIIHALINLLSNGAGVATGWEGRPAQVSLSAQSRAAGVVLTVEGNGPGVAPADRDHSFQPFFTTKAEGAGVGLSFAPQVILSHGGALRLADGRAGRGAVFEVVV